jgi:hypothetical protein
MAKWTVIERVERLIPGAWWLVRCDCGYQTLKRTGEFDRQECPRCTNYKGRTKYAKHRRRRRSKVDYEHFALTIMCWRAMISRCQSSNSDEYVRYGGRGIMVCKRWQNFDNFLADMGERPSCDHAIHRIDNDGNYEPGNCQWVTKQEHGTIHYPKRT